MNEMSPIAAKRDAACAALLQRVREINGSGPMSLGALQQVKGLLSDFAARGSELFPETDFALPNAHGRSYQLADARNDGYGLYLLVSRPGKESAPHDHGIWCATAGLAGSELQRFYRRTDDGSKPGFATVEQIDEMVIAPGTAMVMQDHDIHGTLVIGSGVSRAIGLYGYALTRFPSVVYYHPQFNSCRTMPSRREATSASAAR